MVTKRERDERERRRTSAREWAKKQAEGSSPAAVRLIEGAEWYKLKPGIVRLDFMPYIVGRHNPMADEGMIHFERTYEAHRIPTPDGSAMYCCRAACFGKPCPVCEWLQSQGGHADQDLVKSLRKTTRHLWLVNDRPGDAKNPLKVLDTNHYNRGLGFGEQIVTAVNAVEDYEHFADLDGGYTVQLNLIEQTFPGGKFTAANRIDFIARKYGYPETVLNNAPCLDEMLVDVGYEALKKALSHGPAEEEEPPPARSSAVAAVAAGSGNGHTGAKDQEEEDEEEEPGNPLAIGAAKAAGFKLGAFVMYRGVECEIVSFSDDGERVRLKDEDDDEYFAKVKDCKKVAVKEDEEEPKPARGKGRASAPPVTEDEDDDEEDEDDDEEDDEEEDDEEEDVLDEDEEDEDDEEEEKKPRRKPTRQ